MNSYELSRAFFDWSFDNPEKVNPIHAAIFFFAIEHCNRLGWKEKFGFPSQMVMDAIGQKTWRTYSKALNELVDFGFIKMIEKSKNQYSANIISLCACDYKAKALDKAMSKHSQKHSQSTVKSKASINKPLNLITNKLYKPIVDFLNKEVGSSFRSTSKKTQSLISARINEGFEKEDFEVVIKSRSKKWKNDPKMKEYLRPETLFGTKFEGYLQDAKTESNSVSQNGNRSLGYFPDDEEMSEEDCLLIYGQKTRPGKAKWL